MIGNFIRDWNAYGAGWHLRVQLEAADEAAYKRAMSSLRMIGAGREITDAQLLKEESDATE